MTARVHVPDAAGRFGPYGGRFVPETLSAALEELTVVYDTARGDAAFWAELEALQRDFVGRPTPLTLAPRLAGEVGGGVIVVLKREDLNHTGAHKINNTLGQALLALRMKKSRIIAETGAGQHGVATATVCAKFGLECVVYMGEEDMRRQRLNVYRMELLGARVIPVTSGTATLKDATNEALRDWVTNVGTTHYIIGSVVGPDPFPRMVRDFQAVIGREARRQVLEHHGRLPRTVVACVGGGSNAIGIFAAFLDDADVELVGVEAAGDGLDTERHSASLSRGTPGVFHGSFSYLLQDADGQVHPAHSVSAGLDYPGVGPEHAYLKDTKRVSYETVTDREALDAFAGLARLEGLLPALESAHAVAWVLGRRGRWAHGDVVLVNLSGRGDKDVAHVADLLGGFPVSAAPVPDLELPPNQVEALMQLLSKGLRATQMYLPNNPVYQRAVENIRTGFRQIWQATDDLALDVGEIDLRWEDHVVYQQEQRSESIAWTLFKDGVRSFSLKPGVEDEEIVRFLAVLHRARTMQADAADDLLTLLWGEDFQFISYTFRELATESAAPIEKDKSVPEITPSDVRTRVQGEAPPRPAGVVSMEEFDTTLYFLDDKEIEYLQHETDREYAQDLRRNVLSMLFDLLELQTYGTVRAELLSILENFIPYLLGAGDFRSVAFILRETRVILQRAREVIPEHRQTLEGLPLRLSQQEALSQLLQSLDEAAVHPSEEDLSELFAELRPAALLTLMGWLPRLTNTRVRDLVQTSAERLAEANSAEVLRALSSDDLAAQLEMVRLAGRLKLQGAVEGMGRLLEHGDRALKLALVEALTTIGTPSAVRLLERGVDDGDRDVRIAVVKFLAQRGHRNAFPRVEAAVTGGKLKDADLTEKMAFFEAYGALAGVAGIPLLEKMLVGRGGLLARKEDPETRACAAMALGRIRSPEARAVLDKASQDKEPLVRNAVSRALREVGA